MRCSSPSQGPYLTNGSPYDRDHQVRLVASLLDIVGDTGVGLPEGLDVHATESLGWQLIRILTEQLRGTIALEGHGGLP
jgi:two-component sensor histidine kinase